MLSFVPDLCHLLTQWEYECSFKPELVCKYMALTVAFHFTLLGVLLETDLHFIEMLLGLYRPAWTIC